MQDETKYETQPIAEMTNGIILANYEKSSEICEASYQSEAQLEQKLMEDLVLQGYEKLNIHDSVGLYTNLKIQMEKLDDVSFSSCNNSKRKQ